MELVEKYGFITMVREKLEHFDFTLTTYNALFEVNLATKDIQNVVSFRLRIVNHPLIFKFRPLMMM